MMSRSGVFQQLGSISRAGILAHLNKRLTRADFYDKTFGAYTGVVKAIKFLMQTRSDSFTAKEFYFVFRLLYPKGYRDSDALRKKGFNAGTGTGTVLDAFFSANFLIQEVALCRFLHFKYVTYGESEGAAKVPLIDKAFLLSLVEFEIRAENFLLVSQSLIRARDFLKNHGEEVLSKESLFRFLACFDRDPYNPTLFRVIQILSPGLLDAAVYVSEHKKAKRTHRAFEINNAVAAFRHLVRSAPNQEPSPSIYESALCYSNPLGRIQAQRAVYQSMYRSVLGASDTGELHDAIYSVPTIDASTPDAISALSCEKFVDISCYQLALRYPSVISWLHNARKHVAVDRSPVHLLTEENLAKFEGLEETHQARVAQWMTSFKTVKLTGRSYFMIAVQKIFDDLCDPENRWLLNPKVIECFKNNGNKEGVLHVSSEGWDHFLTLKDCAETEWTLCFDLIKRFNREKILGDKGFETIWKLWKDENPRNNFLQVQGKMAQAVREEDCKALLFRLEDEASHWAWSDEAYAALWNKLPDAYFRYWVVHGGIDLCRPASRFRNGASEREQILSDFLTMVQSRLPSIDSKTDAQIGQITRGWVENALRNAVISLPAVEDSAARATGSESDSSVFIYEMGRGPWLFTDSFDGGGALSLPVDASEGSVTVSWRADEQAATL